METISHEDERDVMMIPPFLGVIEAGSVQLEAIIFS